MNVTSTTDGFSEMLTPPVNNASQKSHVEPNKQPELTTSYSYNNEANMFVMTFIDESKVEPNKVVKQIPPEYMLALARERKAAGNVVDTTA